MAHEWWTLHKRSEPEQVVFFQVDLSGHSRWAEDGESKFTAAKHRAQFSLILEDELARVGFKRLHWLGDGGLFARPYERKRDAQAVCDAADVTFEWFERWCQMFDLENLGLAIRVSATYDDAVVIDPIPGNWFSTGMNLFLKYERAISYPNAFVITEKLRQAMDPDSPQGKRFGDELTVHISDAPKRTITVWAHESHPRTVQQSESRFFKWLSEKRDSKKLPAGVLPEEDIRPWYQVGRAVILDCAYDLDGYRTIELKPLEGSVSEEVILSEDKDDWRQRRDELASRRGTRMSVVRFRGELTDDPIVRLDWCNAGFADVRAFHSLLEDKPGACKRYLGIAKRVYLQGTDIPNTLGNHIVILLKNGVGTRDVLIAHRRAGRRPGSWFDDCWSFSMEEQYNPVHLEIGKGKELVPDVSIHEAIIRGVKEEFLGLDFREDVLVRIHAFQMESLILNFGFLAIVDLPQTTFEDLKGLWSHAPDKEEHDAIAAFALTPERLERCLESEGLPRSLWDEIIETGKYHGEQLGLEGHGWHPTSHARIALALWHVGIQQQ